MACLSRETLSLWARPTLGRQPHQAPDVLRALLRQKPELSELDASPVRGAEQASL